MLDIRRRTGWLFVAVTIGHLVLISAQVNTERGVPLLEELTFGTVAEVQRATTSAVGTVEEGWQNYFALQEIRRENERLRQEVAQLEIRLQEERALAAQARSLAELLDLRTRIELSTVAGTIVRSTVIGGGADPTAEFRTVTIDKGTRDGLRRDMAVIAPAGIVGRILTPGTRASKVQLLLDGDAAAAALVERSRVQGLAVGTGNDCLRLDYVPPMADIQVGDRIVTSGIDGIYPKGLAIGQIESVEGECDGTGIVVRPAVDFSTLEAVLVVTIPPPDAEADAAVAEAP